MSKPPPKGQMYLFDSVSPPLHDGSYRLTAATNVEYSQAAPSFSEQRFFDVVGPRFSVPSAMVAGTFPPANSHGDYQNKLPHIVLSRRTLPWERVIAPTSQIPVPTHGEIGPQPIPGPVPWVALLLFEEGEYTFQRNMPLDQVLGPDVFQKLGSPANITCDAVTAPLDLVKKVMPSVEELQLLSHVRWVNVDDRELNAADGDGHYAVVVANRLPQQQKQYRAFLVSLEGRLDLVTADPPSKDENPPPAGGAAGASGNLAGKTSQTAPRVSVSSGGAKSSLPGQTAAGPTAASGPVNAAEGVHNREIDTSFALSEPPAHTIAPAVEGPGRIPDFLNETSLIVLTSWKFTCEGPGPFRKLMQNLDVAMFGTVQDIGHPALGDTGHLQMTLQDRLGASESVWYRGPLVPWQLTRDDLGPYHSADQCRRVTPETGAEDISYAAAFEIGRLLAAADPRLAKALMQWRRESYKQSARASTIRAFNSRVPLDLPAGLAEQLHISIVPKAAASAIDSVVASGPIIADAQGLDAVSGAPGLSPVQLAFAWNLSSPNEAETLLAGTGGTLGAAVSAPRRTSRPDTTLGAVASDTGGLDRLSAARDRIVENATGLLEEP